MRFIGDLLMVHGRAHTVASLLTTEEVQTELFSDWGNTEKAFSSYLSCAREYFRAQFRTCRHCLLRSNRVSTAPRPTNDGNGRAGRARMRSVFFVGAAQVPILKDVAWGHQGHGTLVCDENKTVAVKPGNVTIANVLRVQCVERKREEG